MTKDIFSTSTLHAIGSGGVFDTLPGSYITQRDLDSGERWHSFKCKLTDRPILHSGLKVRDCKLLNMALRVWELKQRLKK